MSVVKSAFYLKWKEGSGNVLERFKDCENKSELLRLIGETTIVCLNLPRPKRKDE